jgi:hypothetical protein
MAIPKTEEEKADDKVIADKALAAKPEAKASKKTTMVIAEKCTCTDPYSGEVFLKGVIRDTPKKKGSWYESQLEGGYLREVKV